MHAYNLVARRMPGPTVSSYLIVIDVYIALSRSFRLFPGGKTTYFPFCLRSPHGPMNVGVWVCGCGCVGGVGGGGGGCVRRTHALANGRPI